jgi:hypothetical protein
MSEKKKKQDRQWQSEPITEHHWNIHIVGGIGHHSLRSKLFLQPQGRLDNPDPYLGLVV